MKNLLISTAMVAFVAAPAFSESHEAAKSDASIFAQSGDNSMISADLSAAKLIGMRIYTSDAPASEEDGVLEISDTWEDIGEVNDILLSAGGSVEAVLLDIGGFLGIGERTVAIRMDEIQLVNDKDADGDFFLVVNADRATMEAAPEYDLTRVGAWAAATVEATEQTAETASAETAEALKETTNAAAATMDNTADKTAEAVENASVATQEAVGSAAAKTEQAVDTAAAETEQALDNAAAETEQAMNKAAAETEQAMNKAAAETEQAADAMVAEAKENMAPEVTVEGYSMAKVADLTTEDLTGAELYDVNDENIGEVSKLILDDQGNISQAVLDVGGFLGLGEHSVAVDMTRLNVQRANDGDMFRVYIDATEEELEKLPEYEE